MHSATEPILFTLLCAGWAHGWDHVGVEALDASLGAAGVSLVAFVSPSEPKSQALEKEWLSAASGSQGNFLSVNCETESALCTKHEISSHPTMKLFENGAPVTTYKGPRRASGISNFASRLNRPVITELDSESVDSFRAADEVVFIGYLGSKDDAARQAFATMAEKYRDEFTFGLVTDDALVAAQNLDAPTVVCYDVEDGETRTFKSFGDPSGLDKFVPEAARPVISELTPYNHHRLLDRGWPMVYVFGETEGDRAELRKTLKKFAKSYYDSLTCVTVDHLEFPDLQVKLGLEPGVFPSGAVHQLSKDRIYTYPRGQPFDSRSLQKWGLDVWQGRVKPWTPPGATTAYEDAGPTKAAKRKVSVANIPGVNIRVGGRDEL